MVHQIVVKRCSTVVAAMNGAHHAAVVVVVLQVAEVGLEQRGLGVVADRRRGSARAEELLVDVADHAAEQVFLVLEIPVEAAERETGLGCDIAHAGVDVTRLW